jgi:hypothetical protein
MTTETVETGGLVGLAKRAKASATNSIGNHDTWAIRLVFVAGVATIVHKAGIEIQYYAVVFGICLGLAALLYEMNAATYALRSFWKGRVMSAVGWSAIWSVAFGYSVLNWVGAASESEANKTNMHKTAFVQSEDIAKATDAAKRDYDRLQARIAFIEGGFEVNGVKYQVRSVDAAQADMDNAKSNRFWGLTKECTDTKGPQTRAFCDAFARARSERALAAELITARAELPALRQAYESRLNQKQSTKVQTSDQRGDMLVLTKLGGFTDETAQTFTAIGSIVVISIFLSFATALRELEHLRAQGPRVKLMSGRIGTWFRRLVFGKVHTYSGGDTIVQSVDGTITTRSLVNPAMLIQQRVKAAA